MGRLPVLLNKIFEPLTRSYYGVNSSVDGDVLSFGSGTGAEPDPYLKYRTSTRETATGSGMEFLSNHQLSLWLGTVLVDLGFSEEFLQHFQCGLV